MPFPRDDRGAAVMARIMDSLHRVWCACLLYAIAVVVVLCVTVRYLALASAPLRARYREWLETVEEELNAEMRRQRTGTLQTPVDDNDDRTSLRELMRRNKKVMLHLMRGSPIRPATDTST